MQRPHAQRRVLQDVVLADLQQVAMRRQAAHGRLQLVVRQAVQRQVHARAARLRGRTGFSSAARLFDAGPMPAPRVCRPARAPRPRAARRAPPAAAHANRRTARHGAEREIAGLSLDCSSACAGADPGRAASATCHARPARVPAGGEPRPQRGAGAHPGEHGGLERRGARVADVRVVQPGECLLQERALGRRPARREHLRAAAACPPAQAGALPTDPSPPGRPCAAGLRLTSMATLGLRRTRSARGHSRRRRTRARRGALGLQVSESRGARAGQRASQPRKRAMRMAARPTAPVPECTSTRWPARMPPRMSSA